MNNELKTRLKSLAWRAGMMALAVFLSVIAEGLSGLQIGGKEVVVAGLVLGEISKYLNSQK